MKKNYIIWNKTCKVFSPRIQQAIQKKKITRRVVYRGGAVHWYAKCSVEGCPDDYNFTQTNTFMSRKEMCQQHANPRSVVDGRLVYSDAILQNLDRIVWVDREFKKAKIRTAHVRCITPDCVNAIQINLISPKDIRKYTCRACGTSSLRKRPFESTYNQWKKNTLRYLGGKDQHFEIDITYEQFYSICHKETKCHYCKCLLNRAEHSQLSSIYKKFGASYLDRIDPKKGYTEQNLVACCGACNFTKSKWLIAEEMMYLGFIRQGKIKQAMSMARKAQIYIANHYVSLRREIGHHESEPLKIDRSQALVMYKDFLNDASRRKLPVPVRLPFFKYCDIVQRSNICFYCGDTLARIYKRKNRGFGIRHGLDRKDPRKGYMSSNIVSACSMCNLTRGVWISFEEMQIIAAMRIGDTGKAESICAKSEAELLYWGKLTQVFDVKMMQLWVGSCGRRR